MTRKSVTNVEFAFGKRVFLQQHNRISSYISGRRRRGYRLKSRISPESPPFHAITAIRLAMDPSRIIPILLTHSGNIREITVKKNGVKSVSRMFSGVCTIQLREKAIVDSPTYGLAASADLSTSGTTAN